MSRMSTGVNRRLTLHPKVDPVTRCIILIVGSGTGKTNRARYSLELKFEAVRLSGARESIVANATTPGLTERIASWLDV